MGVQCTSGSVCEGHCGVLSTRLGLGALELITACRRDSCTSKGGRDAGKSTRTFRTSVDASGIVVDRGIYTGVLRGKNYINS